MTMPAASPPAIVTTALTVSPTVPSIPLIVISGATFFTVTVTLVEFSA